MDTLMAYLNSMFANLPKTTELRRAKDALAQMMMDQFQALVLEGKTRDEAIDTVIAAFGSLDEALETMGIHLISPRAGQGGQEPPRQQAAQAQAAPQRQAAAQAQAAPQRQAAAQVQTAPQRQVTRQRQEQPRRQEGARGDDQAFFLSLEETRSCLRDLQARARYLGIGVMLCIVSPAMTMLAQFFSSITDNGPRGSGRFPQADGLAALLAGNRGVYEGLGVVAMLAAIAAAVVLFVQADARRRPLKRWRQYGYSLMPAAAQRLQEEYEERKGLSTACLSVGVGLCVSCAIPTILLERLDLPGGVDFSSLGVAGTLLMCGLGVGLLVWNSKENEARKRMLALGRRPLLQRILRPRPGPRF